MEGWMIGSVLLAVALCGLAIVLPLRAGLRRVEQFEF
jgi:hypothetical protein